MKEMWSNKKTRILLICEAIVLGLCLIMSVMPKKQFHFDASNVDIRKGVNDNGSILIEQGTTDAGTMLVTSPAALGYGTYEATISYQAVSDNNFVFASVLSTANSEEKDTDRLYVNTVTLKADAAKDTLDFFVKIPQKDYVVQVFYMGDTYFRIDGITLRQTAGGYLRLFLIFSVIFATINIIYTGRRRYLEGRLSEESIRVALALCAIVVFSSIPLFLNYLLLGHDLTFHLLRIEGIRDALLMGEFPTKVQPNWLNGNGYAASVFYGDLFLYIPALLRICGFMITESYNIFVVLCNIATCLITYFCVREMTGKKNVAVLASALYTASLYRLIDIYVRSSVGEYLAMTFLPLVIFGLYKVFTEDVNSKNYGRLWILSVLGFSGIINSHILTCEMAGLFTIILCLIEIKKVFRKETFIVLVKIVLFTVLLNLGFLVPFLHYYLEKGFIVTDVQRFGTGIQQYGAFLGQLLIPFASYSGLAVPTEEGMAGEMPATAGLALLIGAIVMLYVAYLNLVESKSKKRTGIICVIFGVISLILSTNSFPWDTFQRANRLFNTLVSMISMPWRFLAIASAAFTVAAAIGCVALSEHRERAFGCLCAVLIAVTAIQGGALMSGVMNTYPVNRIYNDGALDSADVIGGEYLPAGTTEETYADRLLVPSENLTVKELDREYNQIKFHADNASASEGSVTTSLVAYSGYGAQDMATGQKFEVVKTENHYISVIIPAGYSGDIFLKFEGFWFWTLSYIVSFVTAIFVVINMVGEEKCRKIWRRICRRK